VYEPDRTIDLGPVTLAVDDRGGGTRAPLVLMHGFTGGRIDFADVIDDLAVDRRVVIWDHRGHSNSTNTGDPESYTFDLLVADAIAAVDALGLDRFHLLGHSMGGVVAQRLALEQPERIVSLVAMDTLAEAGSAIPQSWIDKFVAMGRTDGMGAVAETMATFSNGTSVALEADRPRIAARNQHKLTNMDVEAFASLARQLRTFDSLLPRLAEITCPTTVIVGELDVALRAQSDAITAAIPGAELVVIDGAGHCPQEERRDAWLAAMRRHLAATDG
jgi:pimeloyl-ACP methyl ester carboxylesterase